MLSPWYFPLKILRWEDAITQVYLGKVDVVVEYDEVVRSPSTSIKMPAVVRLRRKISARKSAVKFSRINVYTRDDFTCQYCGEKKSFDELNYDHVVPRSAGGRTVWENIVTSCYSCNSRKANRTCDEAGMWPVRPPKRPTSLPLTPPPIRKRDAPAEWEPFIPR